MPANNPKLPRKSHRVTYNKVDCYYELVTPAGHVLMRFPRQQEADECLTRLHKSQARSEQQRNRFRDA